MPALCGPLCSVQGELSDERLRHEFVAALQKVKDAKPEAQRILIIPPDITRLHSKAGECCLLHAAR